MIDPRKRGKRRPGWAPAVIAMRRLANQVVTGLRPRLGHRQALAVDSLVSLLGDGPLLLAPAASRVLALAAHPDDETIGCGATLVQLARMGATVDVVSITDGGASLGSGVAPADLAARRRGELTAACRVLGAREPHFLGLEDGRVAHTWEEAVPPLVALLRKLRPQIVFTPWPFDDHPDHRAVTRALARALQVAGGDVEIWCYEVWSALPPNRMVDVTDSWHVKGSALERHASAGDDFDVSAFLALGRWRSTRLRHGRGHVEAFLVLDPANLAASMPPETEAISG